MYDIHIYIYSIYIYVYIYVHILCIESMKPYADSPRLMSLTVERDRLKDERDRLWQEAGEAQKRKTQGVAGSK